MGNTYTNWTILSGPVCTLLTGIEGNQKSGIEIESRELSHPHHRKFRELHSDQKWPQCQVYRISFFHFPSLDSPVLSEPRATLPEMGSIQNGSFHRNQNQLKIPMDCPWGTFISWCQLYKLISFTVTFSIYRHCAGDHIRPFGVL